MSLVGLLIFIIVAGLIFYLAWMLVNLLPLPAPFKTAALCVLILIAIIVLLDMTGVLSGAGGPALRLR